MSIARNTFHYTLALVFQKILGFIYFALIARGLGVVDIGRYTLALSITTIFAVFVDLGLTPVLIREIAKVRNNTQQIFSHVVSLKIIFALLAYAAVTFFVNAMGYSVMVKELVYIAGIVMMLDSFSLVFWGLFRGFQNLKFESLGVIIFQVTNVTVGLTVLYLGYGVKAVMLALLSASIIFFLTALYLVIKKLKLQLRLYYNKEIFVKLLKMALPFALAGVFARIYTQLDTIMLSKFSCDIELAAAICEQNVGWYSIASKVTLALQFIPLALSASLFPDFAEKAKQAYQTLKPTYLKAQKYLMFIGFPLSFSIMVTAPELVSAIWSSNFAPAAKPLQILMLSLIFLFLTFPNGALLNALGKQAVNTTFMGFAVVFNILLNTILIPVYNMMGAAVASLVSTFVLFILGFYLTNKLINAKMRNFIGQAYKPFIAALVMSVLLYFYSDIVNVFVLIILGMVLYLLLNFLLKTVATQEWLLLKNLFKNN
jgi:O-antigen/teichoic acid export membrane protein